MFTSRYCVSCKNVEYDVGGSREKSYNLTSILYIFFSSSYENFPISICCSRNFLNLSRKIRKSSKFQFSKRYSYKKNKEKRKKYGSFIKKKNICFSR